MLIMSGKEWVKMGQSGDYYYCDLALSKYICD